MKTTKAVKNNMKSVITFICAIALLSFASCNKDENNDNQTETTPSVASSNVQGALAKQPTTNWQVTSFTINSMKQDCRLDDTMVFNDNGTYAYSSGTNLCGTPDIASKSGTWVYEEASGELIFDKGTSDEARAKVTEAMSNSVVVTGSWMGITLNATISEVVAN